MTQGSAKDVAAVVRSAGEIVGRTRLQKTLTLLEISGLGYGFDFEYYKFGPYSEGASLSLDRSIDLNYVKESQRRSSWGGTYSIFKADKQEPTGVEPRDKLIAIARDSDAVSLELAVTAAFLASSEHCPDPWSEVARRKPEKAQEERLVKAKALYRLFLSVEGMPKSLPVI